MSPLCRWWPLITNRYVPVGTWPSAIDAGKKSAASKFAVQLPRQPIGAVPTTLCTPLGSASGGLHLARLVGVARPPSSVLRSTRTSGWSMSLLPPRQFTVAAAKRVMSTGCAVMAGRAGVVGQRREPSVVRGRRRLAEQRCGGLLPGLVGGGERGERFALGQRRALQRGGHAHEPGHHVVRRVRAVGGERLSVVVEAHVHAVADRVAVVVTGVAEPDGELVAAAAEVLDLFLGEVALDRPTGPRARRSRSARSRRRPSPGRRCGLGRPCGGTRRRSRSRLRSVNTFDCGSRGFGAAPRAVALADRSTAPSPTRRRCCRPSSSVRLSRFLIRSTCGSHEHDASRMSPRRTAWRWMR